MATPSARRRTRSPSRLMTSIVASSAALSETEMWLTSRLPSPLGEKKCAIRPTLITDGEFFSRWATKKAANVAPTRIRNVTRATMGIALIELGTLVLAEDDDSVVL